MSNEKSNTDELQSLQDFESPAKALKRSMYSFEGVLNCDDLEALRDRFEQCEALNAYNTFCDKCALTILRGRGMTLGVIFAMK